jgi:biopolymer transport protein ExbD
MSFQFEEDGMGDMFEINMTPLVDVMLVLLVVFMVTLPVMKHAVNVNLPKASAAAIQSKQEPIKLTVTAEGAYLWNERAVDARELEQLFKTHASRVDQAVIQLQGDASVRYEKVAQVLAMAKQQGVQKLSVVTQAAR